MPCISGNRLACFNSRKFSFPSCPWLPKDWNYNGIIFMITFILVFKRYALMRGFQIWSQNWNRITFDPISGHETVENWQNGLFCQWVKYYQISILRPDLESPHEEHLDTKMKGVKNFISPNCNFKTLVARGRGMNILEKWNMPICFQRYRAR